MKIIEKIKKIIFVCRPETNNKWWHRLAEVIFYGGALAILFGTPTYMSVSQNLELNLFSTEISSFSFSDSYDSSKGAEVDCTIYQSTPKIVFCNGKDVTASAVYAYKPDISLDLKLDSNNNLPTFAEMREASNKMNNEVIESIFKTQGDSFKAKEVNILLPDIFVFVGIILLMALAWIVILQSIFYRIVLYIVFGKTL